MVVSFECSSTPVELWCLHTLVPLGLRALSNQVVDQPYRTGAVTRSIKCVDIILQPAVVSGFSCLAKVSERSGEVGESGPILPIRLVDPLTE